MINKFQREGANAFRKGTVGRTSVALTNPYNPNTQRNREWELGFNKAYFQNLEQVQKKECTCSAIHAGECTCAKEN